MITNKGSGFVKRLLTYDRMIKSYGMKNKNDAILSVEDREIYRMKRRTTSYEDARHKERLVGVQTPD